MFAEITRDRSSFAQVAAPRGGPLEQLVYRTAAPAAAPVLRLRYGIKPDTAEAGREKTRLALDRVSAELQPSGYLVGEGFSVADLTAASLLMPIVWPEEAEYLPPGPFPDAIQAWHDSVSTHPAFEWVQDMYRRHRGASAEIAA
jgi:glutathione S-transferase